MTPSEGGGGDDGDTGSTHIGTFKLQKDDLVGTVGVKEGRRGDRGRVEVRLSRNGRG